MPINKHCKGNSVVLHSYTDYFLIKEKMSDIGEKCLTYV